jgi:hypothetical protein
MMIQNISSFDSRDRHYHLYHREFDRTSCDTSGNVCPDLTLLFLLVMSCDDTLTNNFQYWSFCVKFDNLFVFKIWLLRHRHIKKV